MEEQRTKRTNCKYGVRQINIIGKLQEINYLGRFIVHSLPKPFCNHKIIATTRNFGTAPEKLCTKHSASNVEKLICPFLRPLKTV